MTNTTAGSTDSAQALTASDAALDRLETGLKIDKFNLDEEMIEHPTYLNKVGQRHAEAVSYRDEAKANLEGIKARLGLDLRAAHIERQEKFTEGSIEAEITTHPDFQRAQYMHGAWNDRVNRWKVVWESASARTDMLKGLGQLNASGYWADRAAAGPSREATASRAADTKRAFAASAGSGTVRKKLPLNDDGPAPE